jgi:hypothetical protein
MLKYYALILRDDTLYEARAFYYVLFSIIQTKYNNYYQ